MNHWKRQTSFFVTTSFRLPQSFAIVFALTIVLVPFSNLIGLGPGQSVLVAAVQDDADQRAFETASLAQNNESYEFAIKEWDKLLAQHPDSKLAPRASYNAGVCSLQLGQYEKAIAYFKTASPKLDAESGLKPKSNLFLGFAQFRHGKDLQDNQAQQQQATDLSLIHI